MIIKEIIFKGSNPYEIINLNVEGLAALITPMIKLGDLIYVMEKGDDVTHVDIPIEYNKDVFNEDEDNNTIQTYILKCINDRLVAGNDERKFTLEDIKFENVDHLMTYIERIEKYLLNNIYFKSLLSVIAEEYSGTFHDLHSTYKLLTPVRKGKYMINLGTGELNLNNFIEELINNRNNTNKENDLFSHRIRVYDENEIITILKHIFEEDTFEWNLIRTYYMNATLAEKLVKELKTEFEINHTFNGRHGLISSTITGTDIYLGKYRDTHLYLDSLRSILMKKSKFSKFSKLENNKKENISLYEIITLLEELEIDYKWMSDLYKMSEIISTYVEEEYTLDKFIEKLEEIILHDNGRIYNININRNEKSIMIDLYSTNGIHTLIYDGLILIHRHEDKLYPIFKINFNEPATFSDLTHIKVLNKFLDLYTK